MPAVHAWLRRAPATQDEAAEARRELAKSYRRVFGTDDGQAVLADLLRRSGVMLSSYQPDTHETAFREGQRRLGLYLIEMVTQHPDAALKLAQSGDTESLFA